MKRLIAVLVVVLSASAAVCGWRQYRECFPQPVLFAAKVDSEEDLDLLDGPVAILVAEDSLRGLSGLFNRVSLCISNRMICVRRVIIQKKLKSSNQRRS